MGHSHLDGAHTHGASSGTGALDQAAQQVAVIAVAVAGIDVVTWVLHILVIIATAIGFLVLGAGGGYAWVKLRQPAIAGTANGHSSTRPTRLIHRSRSRHTRGRSPMRCRPLAGILHLHLPPGLTAEQIAQIMRSPRALSMPPGERGDAW
jgi:hypothetical protein